MLSSPGMQALHQLRGWQESLKEENHWVFETTIRQYNAALESLAGDVGVEILGFRIDDSELRRLPGHSGGERQVLWGPFMSKLNGALGYTNEMIAASTPSGPPPIPRESLRPILRGLVEAHYCRPPEEAGAFWVTRATDGLALSADPEASEPVIPLTWNQANQLQEGGFITRKKNSEGREFVSIEEAGFAAYRELVRLEEAERPEGQPIERRAPMNNKV